MDDVTEQPSHSLQFRPLLQVHGTGGCGGFLLRAGRNENSSSAVPLLVVALALRSFLTQLVDATAALAARGVVECLWEDPACVKQLRLKEAKEQRRDQEEVQILRDVVRDLPGRDDGMNADRGAHRHPLPRALPEGGKVLCRLFFPPLRSS